MDNFLNDLNMKKINDEMENETIPIIRKKKDFINDIEKIISLKKKKYSLNDEIEKINDEIDELECKYKIVIVVDERREYIENLTDKLIKKQIKKLFQ